jgi:hypothetical protein
MGWFGLNPENLDSDKKKPLGVCFGAFFVLIIQFS